jgi:hypothetical protein
VEIGSHTQLGILLIAPNILRTLRDAYHIAWLTLRTASNSQQGYKQKEALEKFMCHNDSSFVSAKIRKIFESAKQLANKSKLKGEKKTKNVQIILKMIH